MVDFQVEAIYECSASGDHEVWVQVKNAGTAATTGTWVDVFVGRVTPPAMGEIGDAWTHTGPLNPGQSQWYAVEVDAPASGGAYIDVLLDTDELVVESDETDNADWLWSSFTRCGIVELEVQSLATPATACRGEDIGPRTALTLRNPGPVGVSSSFSVAWYLSSNSTWGSGDKLLVGGRDLVTSLSSGGSAPVGIYTNKIPANALLGSQYLLAVIDELGAVSEANESDNVRARPISIRNCPSEGITAGDYHTCVLSDTGAVRCWGSNHHGQLGYGHTDSIGDDELPSIAGAVDLGGTAVQIASGVYHTCALLDTGAARCWGSGGAGELGYGHTANIGDDELPSAAGSVGLGGTAVQIAAGGSHACALLDTGALRCWGLNHTGQLGQGNTHDIGDDELPSAVGSVNLGGTAVQIAAGLVHTCALLSTGAVRCWGSNYHGQLGYGHTDSIGDDELPSSAGDVDLGGAAVQIAAGSFHTCALLSTGAVRCWGFNGAGALGYGHTDSIGDDELPSAAGSVGLGGTAVQLTAGSEHTCALLSTGAVRCWGFNGSGQLGYNHTEFIGNDELPSVAGDVDLGGTAVRIATGSFHTCALLDTGAVRCWGLNHSGQLGYGHNDDIGDDELPSSAGDVQFD